MNQDKQHTFANVLFRRMIAGGAFASQIVLLFTALIIFYDVVLRYVFNRPATWVLEISEYMLVFLTFMGLANVQKKKLHIRMDFFYIRYPPGIQKYFDFFFYLIMTLFSSFFFWTSLNKVLIAYQYGSRSNSLLETPLFIPYSIVPLGMFLLIIQSITDLTNSMRKDIKKTDI